MAALDFQYQQGDIARLIFSRYDVIAEASQSAVEGAGDIMKRQARKSIARAGFSRGWQQALRVNTYPQRPKTSVNAAILIYHKIFYAKVFETKPSTSIAGKPKMWIPLPHAPKKIGGKPLTAARVVQRFGPMVKGRSKRGTPLLGLPIRVKGGVNSPLPPQISLGFLAQGYRKPKPGTLRTIWLFHGRDKVTIPRKFRIEEAIDAGMAQLGNLFLENLEET